MPFSIAILNYQMVTLLCLFPGRNLENLAVTYLANKTPRTSQLRERVARGEAHRSALAMTEGRFDAAPPEATIELSNLGGIKMGRNW